MPDEIPTRDEIIADWRSRLQAAAAGGVKAAPRAAWLVRVRRRLYRFLISLYGDGQWNPPASSQPASSAAKAAPAVSDARGDDAPRPATEPLTGKTPAGVTLVGKPAKSPGEIAAALKAFVGARLEPAALGPLVDGRGDDAWLPLASTSCDIDPRRCAAVLLAAKIVARVVPRRGECIVEVRAREWATAERVLFREIHRLRAPRRTIERARPGVGERCAARVAGLVGRISPRWRLFLASSLVLLLTFPAAWLAVTFVSLISFGLEKKAMVFDQAFLEHFWSVWRGLCLTTLLLVVASYQRRAQNEKRRAPARRGRPLE